MKKRKIGGLILLIIGFLLMLLVFTEARFISWIYGLPLLILGLFIIFNSNEDKIEEIKYSNKKGGRK